MAGRGHGEQPAGGEAGIETPGQGDQLVHVQGGFEVGLTGAERQVDDLGRDQGGAEFFRVPAAGIDDDFVVARGPIAEGMVDVAVFLGSAHHGQVLGEGMTAVDPAARGQLPVGVDEQHILALMGQPDRKVGGQGTLAGPAFLAAT